MELHQVEKIFVDAFGAGETTAFHSPGRVNLIGEHTDYNGGSVLPCALSFGTYGVARRRGDGVIKLASTDFSHRAEVHVNEIRYSPENGWCNYLLGVAGEFKKLNMEIGGLELLISGNIPNGAGLSSSASVELLMSVVLNDFFACGLDMIELVKLSQRAENIFVGMNCGIMDQFAIGMGRKDKAMYLNCGSLEYRYIDAALKGCKLIIGNTNKRRALEDSKFNERRAQCEKAVEYLQSELKLEQLSDLKGIEQLNEYKTLIPEETLYRRARHVVNEIARTEKAAEYLTNSDLTAFGQLMTASHNSLRDDYQVTGFELDTMVETALEQKGILGSRMTGAGFGGCTISLVAEEFADEFIKNTGEIYQSKTGLVPEFYIADIGDGAARL